MNERIKELAEQAGFYITIDGSGIFIPDPHTEDITEVAKKFAELIVREVFDVIEGERFEIYPPVLQRVLEHFGVES